MFENKDLAAEGIEALCTMCKVDRNGLAKFLKFGQDTPAVLELTCGDVTYRAYDFTVDPSRKDEIRAIIDNPSQYDAQHPKERFLTQGARYSDDGHDIVAAFYMVKKIPDQTPHSE